MRVRRILMQIYLDDLDWRIAGHFRCLATQRLTPSVCGDCTSSCVMAAFTQAYDLRVGYAISRKLDTDANPQAGTNLYNRGSFDEWAVSPRTTVLACSRAISHCIQEGFSTGIPRVRRNALCASHQAGVWDSGLCRECCPSW